jgi:type VI secretion system protein ImpA
MAVVALAELTAPVAGDDPCGSDLDLAGDADYMNFVARAEGLLPASFFDGDGKPFDRSSVDLQAEIDALKPFLAKTRDLRLLVLLAKFLVLNRDLEGFTICVSAVATLLREQWDGVHPRGEDGDFSLRMAALASLDDLPSVVLPLQYLPIAEHRRFGSITFRHQMIVGGQAKPREDEELPDATTIVQALTDNDLTTLIARRNWCRDVHVALAEIRQTSIEHAGYEQAVSLDRLPTLVDKMLAFLDSAVAKRDPSAALAPGAVPEIGNKESADSDAAGSAGSVRSDADAAAALTAVADYFSRCERSNPALLLVRQARELIGKSFLDVLRILVPGHVEQAIVHIGRDYAFELPIERLSEFASGSEGATSHDGYGNHAENGEGRGAEAVTAEDGGATSDEISTDSSGGERAGETPVRQSTAPNGPMTHVGASAYRARTRREAAALMEQVAAYYRAVEPSSPIPDLVDRARGLANRDFLSLLKDFLPGSALKSMRDEGS